MVLFGPTGVASPTSCVTLGELRIAGICPKHFIILNEILPALLKTGNLSPIVLDADGSFSEEEDVVTCNSWMKLYNRQLALQAQFHTDKANMIPQYTFAGDYAVGAIERASQEVATFGAGIYVPSFKV